jgi:hypothetical protein
MKTQTSKSGCSALIKMIVIRSTQLLMIADLKTEHNHPLSKEDYAHYIPNRAMSIADPQTKAEITEMIKSKANIRLVLNYLTEKTGSLENIKAIQNLKRNLKLKGKNK